MLGAVGLHPQVKTEISVESKHQTLQGLAFPLQWDAQQAIQALKQKKINYIQLVGPLNVSPAPRSTCLLLLPLTPTRSPIPSVHQKLDLERETIDLVHTSPTEIADLPKRIPQDSARYHFFLYKHSHEGDYLESVGECPGTGGHWLEPVPFLALPGPLLAQGANGDGVAGDLESVPACRPPTVGAGESFGAKRSCHAHCRARRALPWGGLCSHCVAGVAEPGEIWEGVRDGMAHLALSTLGLLGLEKP